MDLISCGMSALSFRNFREHSSSQFVVARFCVELFHPGTCFKLTTCAAKQYPFLLTVRSNLAIPASGVILGQPAAAIGVLRVYQAALVPGQETLVLIAAATVGPAKADETYGWHSLFVHEDLSGA